MDQERFQHKSDYPTDIWRTAEDRWTAMSIAEQQAYLNRLKDQEIEMMNAMRGVVRNMRFHNLFDYLDILWAALAIAAAYKTAISTRP